MITQWCRMCGTVGVPICASCADAGGYRWPLPPGFWDDAELRDALAAGDFGPAFAAARQYTRLSQTRFGAVVGLQQQRVSAIEHGRSRLTSAELVSGAASALGIPADALGFGPDPQVSEPAGALADVDPLIWAWAAAFGSNLHPDIERLVAPMPGVEPVARPTGVGDVHAMETIVEALDAAILTHGGAMYRAPVVALLGQARTCMDGATTEAARSRLGLVTAHTAALAGWCLDDSGDQDGARRLRVYAMSAARHATDERFAVDLAVTLSEDLARQPLHSYSPDRLKARARDAFRMVELGEALVKDRPGRVTAGTLGYLRFARASWHAVLGDANAARTAMGRAEDAYANCGDEFPLWAKFTHSGPGEAARERGSLDYILSLADAAHAPAAVESLTEALISPDSVIARRTRVEALPWLAVAHLCAGDIESAVTVGHEATTAIAGMSSTTGHSRLLELSRLAAQHDARPDVAGLREHIRTALAGAAV